MKKFFLILVFSCFTLFGFSQISETSGGQDFTDEVTMTRSGVENIADPLKLLIPNAFTPNDDMINDFFYVESSGFKEFNFSVFDRMGNRVFSTNNPYFKWDGRINGSQKVLPGIYVFVFQGKTQEMRKVDRSGSISVIY